MVDHKPHNHEGGLKLHEVVDQKVESLQERNARVEADKAWETSWVRRMVIATITYVLVGYHSSLIGVSYPWLNAFVPAGGYFLSTLSIPFIKKFWIKKYWSQ
jgi:hypothetical protein